MRALFSWVRAIARLVPPPLRARWREEWEAELHNGVGLRRLGAHRTLDIMIGVLRDALDTRRTGRRARQGERTGSYGPSLALESLRRNLRYSWRKLRRRPVMTLGVVGTLALGIAANTAIFVVADTVLLKPLPYTDADRLFMIWESGPQETSERTGVSLPDFLDWRSASTPFDDMSAYAGTDVNVLIGERAMRVEGQVVSSNFFRMLGVAPQIGRGFLSFEEDEGRALTVVLSHEFWAGELDRDPAAIGRSLSIDGDPYTITGVMPADFRPPDEAALWLSLGVFDGNLRIWRPTHVLTVMGRLRTGASPSLAEASMTELAQRLWEHAPLWEGWRVDVRPLRTELYGELGGSAGFLWAAGLSLLLVMCANLANLFLAQGVHRRGESALRRALGANRRALLGQASSEIAILCGLAITLGVLLSAILLEGLAVILPTAVTTVYPLELDPRAIAYAVVLAIGSGCVFGLLPSLRSADASVAAALREDGRSGWGHGSARLRGALVACQVALSLALVVTTLLMARSYGHLREVDPGFRARNVVSFRVALAGSRYDGPEARRTFYQEVERALSGMPGVSGVGMGSRVPFVPATAGSGASVFVVDRVVEPGTQQPIADVHRVSLGLLPTLGTAVIQGRILTASDDHDAASVALINRAAASMLWPGQDPLGARIRTGRTGDAELQVVGVVEDVRLDDLRRSPAPQVFLAAAQFPPASQAFVIRTDRAIGTLADEIRSAVASVDPTQPIFDVIALEVYIDRSLAGSILSTSVLSALAMLSAVLAAVGIYAVIAFMVGLRMREFSVRRALGAESGDVLRLVLRRGSTAVATGLAGGVAAAAIAARLISNQLFGVSPFDPASYAGAACAIGVLAVGSALAPALKAARVHPARALHGP